MKALNLILFFVLAILIGALWMTTDRMGINPVRVWLAGAGEDSPPEEPGEEVSLPPPARRGDLSVEEAIYRRRSIRSFLDEPLSLQEASQLLWAAGGKTIDGLTGPTRSYPSAGGAHPLEIYLVAGRVEGLLPGIYRYSWREHSLVRLKRGDRRADLRQAAFGQSMVGQAPASLVFTAVPERTTRRYGERALRYIPMDVGGAGQNVHLQAEALGLGTVIVGAFNDEALKSVLSLGAAEAPYYVMPLGRPSR